MTLVAWLFAIAGPLVVNVLIGLGAGTVTYIGMSALLSALVNHIKTSFMAVPVDLLSFMNMGGIIDAFSIVLGAFSARMLLMSLKKFSMSGA